MISDGDLRDALCTCLDGVDLPWLGARARGKVRDTFRRGDELVLVTTDRLSAFDRVLGLVPFKGQVLNQLSAFWFAETADIIPNHLIAVPDPNVTVATPCQALPVEVVVRGYISGVTGTSLWRLYSEGKRNIYGIDFPDGLRKNDPLPMPVITPTTKALHGGHDERITARQVVRLGIVPALVWETVAAAAVALFRRGQMIARRAGLILVDTKYEFGLAPDGSVMLIDEVHTPDSSRFWVAKSYAARHAAGEEPENFDKEFIRLRYVAGGYRGEGAPPPMPAELAVEAAQRYIRTYELLTGRPFVPAATPAAERIDRSLRSYYGQ